MDAWILVSTGLLQYEILRPALLSKIETIFFSIILAAQFYKAQILDKENLHFNLLMVQTYGCANVCSP